MVTKAIYKPDHAGMQAFMLSEQARKPCIEVAERIVADLVIKVKRSSGSGGEDGHLADSFKVNTHSAPVTLGEAPRVGAEVYSDHPAAAPNEFGGKKNRPKHYLAKAGNRYHVPLKVTK